MPVAKWVEKALQRSPVPVLTDVLYAAVVLAVFLLAMACLVKGTYNPFIYFNF
jgi:alginate O-acetyltransferase complex protein AlgI